MPILLNLFQEIKEGALPNSLYKSSIIQITKPDKDASWEKKNIYIYIYIYLFIYEPISLRNTDVKFLKVLAH